MKQPNSPTLRALHSFALRTLYDVAHAEQYENMTEDDLVRSAQDALERIATGEYQKLEDQVARICDEAELDTTHEYMRLQAAAPDLLAALKMVRRSDFADDDSPTWDAIQAAIAKAEGGGK